MFDREIRFPLLLERFEFGFRGGFVLRGCVQFVVDGCECGIELVRCALSIVQLLSESIDLLFQIGCFEISSAFGFSEFLTSIAKRFHTKRRFLPIGFERVKPRVIRFHIGGDIGECSLAFGWLGKRSGGE